MNGTLSYLRQNKLPHIWCPGCGNGIIMHNIIRAVDELDIDPDNTVVISGIGCSSRAPGYMNFDTLHTAHGRALAFATGVKFANPKLKVIVISGDGDCSAIGGNHFIHACRRNIDITLVVVNNNIYGMTSGQYSPLTPTNAWATTAQYGNIDRPFDLTKLAAASGATYAARASTYHVQLMKNYIKAGLENKGFSVVECISTCPTYFGRKNKRGDAAQMQIWLRDNCEMLKKDVTEYEKPYVLGEFVKTTAPEYTESYEEVIRKAGGAQ